MSPRLGVDTGCPVSALFAIDWARVDDVGNLLIIKEK